MIIRGAGIINAPTIMHVGTFYPPYRILTILYVITACGNVVLINATSYWMLAVGIVPKLLHGRALTYLALC
eukprot:UN03779